MIRTPRTTHRERTTQRRGPLSRFKMFRYALAAAAAFLVLRLLVLQIVDHGFYEALASGQHDLFTQLFPERGDILLKDRFEDKYYPAATNQQLTLIYADTRSVDDPAKTAAALSPLINRTVEELVPILSKIDDPYEPLFHYASDAMADQVRVLKLPGIAFAPEKARVYPEAGIGGHLLGFLGWDDTGARKGRYGLEGKWDAELAGSPGVLRAEQDSGGRWITVTDREFVPAKDGDTIVLTIDRTIQYFACQKVKEAVRRNGATGGQVLIMDPKTGAILAMCSEPDYDPNKYNEVHDINVFSNPAVSGAWEPGSIMKPITLAASMNEGKIGPRTTYTDEGSVKYGPFTVKNSDGKAHGVVDMTTVLEESLNTGAIFAQERIGLDRFRDYLKNFGFDDATGIEISGERGWDLSSLDKRGEIFAATASYGQGITVTPVQMLQAYGALANGGLMMKPHLVAEVRDSDGTVHLTVPSAVRQVVSERTATLLGGMLVSVVENGHGKKAGVAGYRVAGKTGTAQVARTDGPGYEAQATIGSFVGYAPVDDPKFVMLVRIDRPQTTAFAEATAAPVFGEMAAFLLQYFGVPPGRR